MRSRRRRWWRITGAWVCCTALTRRSAWKWVRIGPWKKFDGDSPAKRGGAGKDAPRRAFRARGLVRAAKRGKAGNYDDGPREACRGKNRRKAGQGGVQGIPRLSLRVVHVGEQRDRSRDSVAEAEAARGRYRLD